MQASTIVITFSGVLVSIVITLLSLRWVLSKDLDKLEALERDLYRDCSDL